MQNFTYTVKDKQGKTNSGVITANDRDEAARTLLDQGLTPISIKKDERKGMLGFLKSFQKVPLKEKVMFAEELSTLVNAGVPIAQSLSILQKQTTNKTLSKTVEELEKDVEGGLSLSTSMEKHPNVFSSIFVNMVRAGEAGGTLDEALNQLAVQLAKDQELIAKVKGAMTYPVIIMVGMIGAVIYLMATIVPQLSGMFSELGGQLPASTKFLIAVSNAVTKYWFITFSVMAILVFGFHYIEKNFIPFRRFMHTIFTKMPVFKNLTIKMNVAHFARTLASLLNSGVSVVESLNIVADSTTNLVFKEAIQKAAEKVKNGVSIAEVIKTYKVFPPIVSQMISVGEETCSLDTILKKIADFYDREVENITQNLSTMLEPFMMILIGLMVGFVVVSIITPIYQMTNMY
jgi:type IV pilus assembly protein PilC